MTLAATEAYSDNDFVIRGYHVKLGVPAAF
jgi:hypothetical protein